MPQKSPSSFQSYVDAAVQAIQQHPEAAASIQTPDYSFGNVIIAMAQHPELYSAWKTMQTIDNTAGQIGAANRFTDQAKALGIKVPDNYFIGPRGMMTEHGSVVENVLLSLAPIAAVLGPEILMGGLGVGGAGAATAATATGDMGLPVSLGMPAALPGGVTAGGVGSVAIPSGAAAVTHATAGAAPLTTATKVGDALLAGGRAVGAATSAAGENQRSAGDLALRGYEASNSAANSFENEMMARAREEDDQRHSAMKDVYRNSYAQNPGASPYDPAGPPKFSPEYLATLGGLSNQGRETLAKPAQYGTAGLPPLKKPDPFDPTKYTTPSALQRAGSWISPSLSMIGSIMDLYGR